MENYEKKIREILRKGLDPLVTPKATKKVKTTKKFKPYFLQTGKVR